jgi:peptidoglycan/xylan/chitin deacetylase (PgdA/CDA1 family)
MPMYLPRLDVYRVLRKVFSIAARNLLGTITHVTTQEEVLALTFDDGPHPEYTPRLLEILDRYQARATFFMVGKVAKRHPELVHRIAQAGHAIGNHSWDHPSFPYITGRERRVQIRACAKAIAPYGQKLLRPPYGNQSVASRLDALWLGYKVVTWNIVAYDWLDRDANWMVDQIVDKIQRGSVILFHDALYDNIEKRFANREPTLQAVDFLLERLCDRYRFITITELLKHGRPERQHWYHKADINFLNNLSMIEGEARRYT